MKASSQTFVYIILTGFLVLTLATAAEDESSVKKEHEKQSEETKSEETKPEEAKLEESEEKKGNEKGNDDDDVVVEDDEEEEEDRMPGYPKPTYPKKPDPHAPSGKEHWKECKTSDDCVGSMHECVREKVFELESKSRCFPKWCHEDSDCPLPMVCSKKPEKKHQCDFDIPDEFFRKVDL